eukprot:m.101834 g.101834  ORF g.101834 m.101834 type:complete len:90 (-) comp13209_c0_seq4:54-323(-)
MAAVSFWANNFCLEFFRLVRLGSLMCRCIGVVHAQTTVNANVKMPQHTKFSTTHPTHTHNISRRQDEIPTHAVIERDRPTHDIPLTTQP